MTRPGGTVVAVGLADGQYRNPGGDVTAFTTSYFHRPQDLAGEVTDAGLVLGPGPGERDRQAPAA